MGGICVDQGAPCGRRDCNVCSICKHGFKRKGNVGRTAKATNVKLRYGEGLYFTSVSGKANDYAEKTKKVLMCDKDVGDIIGVGAVVRIGTGMGVAGHVDDRVGVGVGIDVSCVGIGVMVVVVIVDIVPFLVLRTTFEETKKPMLFYNSIVRTPFPDGFAIIFYGPSVETPQARNDRPQNIYLSLIHI